MEPFIQFAETYDQFFRSKICGASPAEIARLEALVARPLPSMYKEYLATMGRRNGDLYLFLDAKCDIDTIIRHYETDKDDPVTFAEYPTDYALIAAEGNATPSAFIYLNNPDDGPVYVGEGLQPTTLCADSFHKLLYQRAFLVLRLNRLPCLRSYYSPDNTNRLNLIAELVSGLHANTAWFSDRQTYCIYNQSWSLIVYQYADSGCFLRIGSISDELLAPIAGMFTTAIPMRPVI